MKRYEIDDLIETIRKEAKNISIVKSLAQLGLSLVDALNIAGFGDLLLDSLNFIP